MVQLGLGQPFQMAPTCLAPGNRHADKVQCFERREGRGEELGFQPEPQHRARAPAAVAARQTDDTRPACSQHRQSPVPTPVPHQLQMHQLRRVPETHFSSPVPPLNTKLAEAAGESCSARYSKGPSCWTSSIPPC